MKKLLLVGLLFFVGISSVYAKEKVTFNKCVDGDTFKVVRKGNIITVRMLAVDAPEVAKNGKAAEYMADDASKYTCKRITNAKKLELEYDSKSDTEDKYGRVLAWVFVDGELLEAELIDKGYAKVAYLYSDYKYADVLLKKQEVASNKNKGIWNTSKKNEYENISQDISAVEEEYTNKEIIIIVILFLIIVFVGDKVINRKAKKKLKKYL